MEVLIEEGKIRMMVDVFGEVGIGKKVCFLWYFFFVRFLFKILFM